VFDPPPPVATLFCVEPAVKFTTDPLVVFDAAAAISAAIPCTVLVRIWSVPTTLLIVVAAVPTALAVAEAAAAELAALVLLVAEVRSVAEDAVPVDVPVDVPPLLTMATFSTCPESCTTET
jgi:hypothetical protein